MHFWVNFAPSVLSVPSVVKISLKTRGVHAPAATVGARTGLRN